MFLKKSNAESCFNKYTIHKAYGGSVSVSVGSIPFAKKSKKLRTDSSKFPGTHKADISRV